MLNQVANCILCGAAYEADMQALLEDSACVGN